MLLVVAVVVVPGLGWFGTPATSRDGDAPGGGVAAAGRGPVVYEVMAPAGTAVTYAAGGTVGSETGRPQSWPWRVTVPEGGPGSVYTVAVPVAPAGSTCVVARDGEELDRRTAESDGMTLTCSAS